MLPASSTAVPEAPRLTVAEVVGEPCTRAMVHAYQRWLGVPHPAAGAACATQHYAGRVAAWVVGGWALTGGLPAVDGCLAEVDDHGRTLRLVVPDEPDLEPCAPLDVVDRMRDHLAPMVEAACRCGRITERLAWGGVATSVAGALLRSAAALDGERGERLLVDAQTMLAEDAWHVPRPLVTLEGVRQRRHTCCLIFLSDGHGRCASCPHHDRER